VILIVHTTNGSRRRHFRAARRLCERLALLQDSPTWEAGFVDRVADVDTRDLDVCLAAARRLDAEERIEGVITFVEHSVSAAAAVAADLGLPFVSPETATLARDKYLMRRAFADAGVPCPGFDLARSVDEALAVADRLGYPLVLKPLIGGGSMFVRRVDGPAELRRHFDTFQAGAWDSFTYDPLHGSGERDYGNALLLEQYVEGGEISVESLVVAGRTHVLVIHDKPLPMRGPLFEEIYHRTPSLLPAATQDLVRDLVARMHASLGVTTGASHAEFRIPAEGPPVALEVAARIGGSGIYASVLTSTGVDMMAAVIEMARGGEPAIPAWTPTPTGMFTVLAGSEGVLRRVDGLADLRRDPAVVEAEVYKSPGDELVVPPRAFQSHGHVVLSADSLAGVDAAFHRLRDRLTFEVDSPVPAT
jgi:biotin carboxylase